jgi:hypothetical protein
VQNLFLGFYSLLLCSVAVTVARAVFQDIWNQRKTSITRNDLKHDSSSRRSIDQEQKNEKSIKVLLHVEAIRRNCALLPTHFVHPSKERTASKQQGPPLSLTIGKKSMSPLLRPLLRHFQVKFSSKAPRVLQT